jgi:hypothetical protein
MTEGLRIIGNITSVLNSYYYGRITIHSGYIGTKSDIKLNPRKFYAMVYPKDDSGLYIIRNMFNESLDEKNTYYEDDYTNIFSLSDTNGILEKYVNDTGKMDHYLVEYTPIPESELDTLISNNLSVICRAEYINQQLKEIKKKQNSNKLTLENIFNDTTNKIGSLYENVQRSAFKTLCYINGIDK